MAIVIYDPDCGFCRFSLALLLAWDGRRRGGAKVLRPLPLGTAEADDLLADLTVEERDASWHLVGESSQVPGGSAAPGASAAPAAPAPRPAVRTSAGAAIPPVLRLLPGGRAPAALFARFPDATERAYHWVTDHRGLLGRFVPGRARRWADRTIAAHGEPGSPP